jgi:hypothetical protein
MAKKATLPASTTKKVTPSKPASPGGRTPPPSGSGKTMPPWMAQAAKKAAPKRTPRKAGGK